MTASFCWQCGKKLAIRGSRPCYRMVTPPGLDVPVAVHVTCAKTIAEPAPDFANYRTKRAVHKYLGG